MAGKWLWLEQWYSDINLQVEQGKKVYWEEKGRKVQTEKEYYAEQAKNILWDKKNSEKRAYSIRNNELLEEWNNVEFIKLFAEYKLRNNNSWITKIEKDWSKTYINDENEEYNYFDNNEVDELKELSKLLESESYSIDFNNLNQWDIPKITQNIRERYEKLWNLNWTNWLAYKKFIKKSTNYHKNINRLDIQEKKDYLDDLINLLMLLKLSNDMIDKVLKYVMRLNRSYA